ncbi:hypothetical protein YDYSY3_48420 [Paenibacillus chitinolyticus]|uniref:hypothetical protein n=1 Tax=Paenibacillus chitinolyticus TaxID=79263 RepID=UPI0026E4E202|nr:hypothetical protein [Paenibacillus chitinolyticus]GKS13842.1 hypothetical protein YDYSY3_48420 [Paenibacillus chitinolyticus]
MKNIRTRPIYLFYGGMSLLMMVIYTVQFISGMPEVYLLQTGPLGNVERFENLFSKGLPCAVLALVMTFFYLILYLADRPKKEPDQEPR